MKSEPRPPLETFFELLVLCAVAAQTFIVINEATEGEAGRIASRWWHGRIRPQLVRVITWLDAHAITERMVESEVIPYLEESS